MRRQRTPEQIQERLSNRAQRFVDILAVADEVESHVAGERQFIETLSSSMAKGGALMGLGLEMERMGVCVRREFRRRSFERAYEEALAPFESPLRCTEVEAMAHMVVGFGSKV